MKHYNKKIEVTRVYQSFILEWEDKDAEEKEYERHRHGQGWHDLKLKTSGTEVFNDKDDLLERIKNLL